MFRYFGFSWDAAAAMQAAAATRLEEAVWSKSDWQPAFGGPGIRVFTIGRAPGVNDIYSLPSARGVILGRLFRRPAHQSRSATVQLTDWEGEHIQQTRGRALVDEYWGRYVALLRPQSGSTLLLRDPSGALPCYRLEIEGVTVFFSWFEDLIMLAPAAAQPHVNWNAIAARLVLRQLGGRETALEGVEQVLPGQLTVLGKGAPPPESLWSAYAFAKRATHHEVGAAERELRRVVVACAQDWSSCYRSILLRLSGGVDSAVLLGGLVATPLATRITCLNYHSAGSDSDERSFARLAASKAGVALVERERNSTFLLDDLLTASRMPTPENYLGRLGSGRIDAEVADAHGAQAMFTGVGGDALFFQIPGTWPAADYLSVKGFDRGFLGACLDAARLGRVSLLESIRQALADRRHASGPLQGWGEYTKLMSRDALDGVRHPERYVHPGLFDAADLPIGKYNQLRGLIDACSYYDPYLRQAAPELVNPLLSQPITEFCLAAPTWLLTDGGRGRGLLRRAFAGDIPREIATRQSKGGMDEHAAAILGRNLAFARTLLLDGQLVRRGLLDRDKVEAALAGRISSLRGYPAETHECIAVEAWLQRISMATH
ncbi:MAG: asparagine synthase-related protein [Pseudomonadota bacterium]|nr:asparagine synthase-related protein [Pseudomonadota bacterium]